MDNTEDLSTSDYRRYRGRCKSMCEEAILADPTLKLVRGHYYCPIWNCEEPHWWTLRPDGTIFDPSTRQFPSNGLGIYTPFDGMVTCVECGKEMPEEDAVEAGSYAVCSSRCYGSLVGVPAG